MKLLVIIMACLFPFMGTAQDQFSISGKLLGIGQDRIVVIRYKDSSGKGTTDSIVVKNGLFAFHGYTAFGNKAFLTLIPSKKDSTRKYPPRDELIFYLEKGVYSLSGIDSISKATVNGPQAQQDYLAYLEQMRVPRANHWIASGKLMKANAAKDTAEIRKAGLEAQRLWGKVIAAEDSFIVRHPDSYVSLDLVVGGKARIIEPATLEPFYKLLSTRVLNSFTGQNLTARYEKAKLLTLGNELDFTQPDTKGIQFKLSSLKGKYVLIDFWASWCGPCRAEIPNLLKAYCVFKSKNFEIVAISLDENKDAWLKAVAVDKAPWVQVSDLKGFKNEVADRLSITVIPQNILINPEGIIIAKNIRGENTTELLAQFIK